MKRLVLAHLYLALARYLGPVLLAVVAIALLVVGFWIHYHDWQVCRAQGFSILYCWRQQ